MQLETLFTEMADALRTKEDTTNKISAESFPQKIRDLKVLDTTDATATANDVVGGKIFYANGKRGVGSIIDNGRLEYTPSDEEQIIPAGKTSGGVVKAINSEELNIIPTTEEQIKEGLFNKVKVECIKTQDLNITPTTEEQKFTGLFKNVTVEPSSGGIDTSDATATAADVLKDKTFYANGKKHVGTLEVASGGELEESFNSCIDSSLGANVTKLPSSLTSIGAYAFYNCTNLALEELPNNVTSIDNYAFNGCTNLPLKKLSSSLKTIGNYAFSNCTNIALVEMPENVTSIGEYAFQKCTNLALEELPDGIKIINAQAFLSCTNMPLKKLPSKLQQIKGNAFSSCTKLAITEIPNSVSTIATYAFSSCTGLTSINLPSNLKQVLSYVFQNCYNLAEITCDSSTLSISSSAFTGCTKLAKFVMSNVTAVATLSNKNAFTGTAIANGTGLIYVPDELVDSFKSASNWSAYADQIKGVSELV